MDASIVTQIDERRKRRALILAAEGHVHLLSPTEAVVTSQSNPDGRYHVDQVSQDGDTITGRCTCPDFGQGHLCKHILATLLVTKAQATCVELMRKHQITIDEVLKRLHNQYAQTSAWEMKHKLLTLANAAQTLVAERDNTAADQHDGISDATPIIKPKTIELVIRYRTSGGRDNPTTSNGELIEIRADGQPKEPKYTDPERAYKFLQASGYQPIDHKWIDPAGYVRRRVSSYQLAS